MLKSADFIFCRRRQAVVLSKGGQRTLHQAFVQLEDPRHLPSVLHDLLNGLSPQLGAILVLLDVEVLRQLPLLLDLLQCPLSPILRVAVLFHQGPNLLHHEGLDVGLHL